MPRLDGALAMLMFHLHSVWWESVLKLAAAVWAGVVGGVVVFVVRLQWQIECRRLPLALRTVVTMLHHPYFPMSFPLIHFIYLF